MMNKTRLRATSSNIKLHDTFGSKLHRQRPSSTVAISQSSWRYNVQFAIALIQATTIYSSLTVDDSSVPGPAAKDPVQSQALGFVAGKFHPFPCLLPQQFPARKLPRMSTNTVIIHMTTEHIPPRQKPQTEQEPFPISQCQEPGRGSGREGCQGGEAPDGGGPEERSSRRTTWSASP